MNDGEYGAFQHRRLQSHNGEERVWTSTEGSDLLTSDLCHWSEVLNAKKVVPHILQREIAAYHRESSVSS